MKRALAIVMGLFIQGFAQGSKLPHPPTRRHRQEVEAVLRTGKDSPTVAFNEDVIAEAARWYEHGDKSVLPALLAASLHADGAASEALGIFLGEQLQMHPRDLLMLVSGMPADIQQRAAQLAVSADGAGWAPLQMKHIRAILDAHSNPKNRGLSATAKVWLAELNRFEASR